MDLSQVQNSQQALNAIKSYKQPVIVTDTINRMQSYQPSDLVNTTMSQMQNYQPSSQTQSAINTLANRQAMPNFRQEVAKVYQDPVINPLVREGASLRSQMLPTLFDNLSKMKTGAANASPMAALSNIGNTLSNLNSRIVANNQAQNFFGTQMGDIASYLTQRRAQEDQYAKDMYNVYSQQDANRYNRISDLFGAGMQQDQMRYGRLNDLLSAGLQQDQLAYGRTSDLYTALYGREQDEMARQERAAARAAQAAQQAAYMDMMRQGMNQGAFQDEIAIDVNPLQGRFATSKADLFGMPENIPFSVLYQKDPYLNDPMGRIGNIPVPEGTLVDRFVGAPQPTTGGVPSNMVIGDNKPKTLVDMFM